MRRLAPILVALALAASTVACGSADSESGDAGSTSDASPGDDSSMGPVGASDSGHVDSSARDSGRPDATQSGGMDSGNLDDSGMVVSADSGGIDSGVLADDSGPADSGPVDSGVADSGAVDSGVLADDSGPADSGPADSGAVMPDDAGSTVDSGAPPVDSGAASDDAGEDSGTVVVVVDSGAGDTGSVSVDSGPLVDSSVPVVIHYVSGVSAATIAGSDVPGTQDGTGAAAEFDNPTGMAVDLDGNLLVTDYDSSRVRHVTPAGVVTTIAAATGFVFPFSAAVATDGSYYVGTDANSAGVKGALTGTVWRVVPAGDGGIATPTMVAQGFGRPRGLAAIAGGDLFVSDRSQDIVEQLTTATGATAILAGTAGVAGFLDSTGVAAEFNTPLGAVALPDGSVLIADSLNNRIRQVTLDGVVTTFAGTGVPSLVNATCLSAGFNAPGDVAVDSAGNVYVSDRGNHVVRRIDIHCTVETLAGTGVAGFNDGPGNMVQLYGQEGIDVTADGKTVYVADGNGGDGSAHHRVRAIAVP